jgi:glycosyltransferase involved in cell wall biosynthesis
MPAAGRDIDAITYGANPMKKGLDRVLEAWQRARREGERLVVAGAAIKELVAAGCAVEAEGVEVVGALNGEEYRALLARSRVFVCAPRREDHGLAQMEALAHGCMLVTTPAPGPYLALDIARGLDERLVGEDLAGALRAALDQPKAGYDVEAARALVPYSQAVVDQVVAIELLPRLMALRSEAP